MSHESFLQAVIAAPDDDGPRLLFADWLDERGEHERAEFIRVQCALEKLARGSAEREELETRERELLDRHAYRWAVDLQPEVRAWTYRRGFVERVEMNLQTSAEEILAVLRKAPIRHVRDTSQMSDLAGVVEALPHLAHFTGLEFWGMYTADDSHLRALLTSPHLQNLQTLILHYDSRGRFADERMMVEALHSPLRSELRELAVNVDGVGRGPSPNLLRAIAESPYLRNLRKLNLSGAGDARGRPPTDLETIRVLGRSPNLAELEDLDLGDAGFSAEGWDEILRWPVLPRLKRLRLCGARQVNAPDMRVAAELAEVREYRRAFELRTPRVDWDTELINPWEAGACWRGHSWIDMSQRHLCGLHRFVRVGDFAGMLAAYRADCVSFAGEEVASAIDALPWNDYERALRPGLSRAVEVAADVDGPAVFLRFRPDLMGTCEYHVGEAPPSAPTEPFEDYEQDEPFESIEGPNLVDAWTIVEDHPPVGPLDPGAARHYVYARLLDAFARCVAGAKSPAPVYFSVTDAAFPL